MANRKRRKSPKVRLDTKKVFITVGVIIVLCMTYLFVNAFFDSVDRVFDVVPRVADAVEQAAGHSEGQTVENGAQGAVTGQKSNGGQSANKTGQKSDDSPPARQTGQGGVQAPALAKANTQAKAQSKAQYAIPEAKNGATLVFIIDDAGQHAHNLRQYTNLPFPLAIAVLPKLAETRECASLVRSFGKELLLHQPMQAENKSINPGPGAIMPDMTSAQIEKVIKENLAELGGGVVGINNHEGSLITEDSRLVAAVLEASRANGVYYLDSRTTAATKVPDVAEELGVHIEERDVFLDNVIDRQDMLEQIYRALAIANKKGKAIIIGHVDKSVDVLPKLLTDMYPYLVEKGYKFAVPSKYF